MKETINWALSRVADWGQLKSEQDFFRHSREVPAFAGMTGNP